MTPSAITETLGRYLTATGVVVVPAAEGAAVCEEVRKQRTLEEPRDARVRNREPLASIIGLAPVE